MGVCWDICKLHGAHWTVLGIVSYLQPLTPSYHMSTQPPILVEPRGCILSTNWQDLCIWDGTVLATLITIVISKSGAKQNLLLSCLYLRYRLLLSYFNSLPMTLVAFSQSPFIPSFLSLHVVLKTHLPGNTLSFEPIPPQALSQTAVIEQFSKM